MKGVRTLPGVNSLVSSLIMTEAAKSARDLLPRRDDDHRVFVIPSKGLGESVIPFLKSMKDRDTHAEKGKLFGYVYTMDGAQYQVQISALCSHKDH